MYFKTKIDSETGKKFNAILKKAKECKKATKALSEKIGFSEWYGGYGAAYGGISAVVFRKEPDRKIWKKVGKGFMPKVAQKEMRLLFDDLPVVRDKELNDIVNFNSFWSRIGFSPNKGKYHLFSVPIDGLKVSDYNAPKDCIEITVSEYHKIEKEND